MERPTRVGARPEGSAPASPASQIDEISEPVKKSQCIQGASEGRLRPPSSAVRNPAISLRPSPASGAPGTADGPGARACGRDPETARRSSEGFLHRLSFLDLPPPQRGRRLAPALPFAWTPWHLPARHPRRLPRNRIPSKCAAARAGPGPPRRGGWTPVTCRRSRVSPRPPQPPKVLGVSCSRLTTRYTHLASQFMAGGTWSRQTPALGPTR